MDPNAIREEITLPRVRIEKVKYRNDSTNFQIVIGKVIEGGNTNLTGRSLTLRGNLPRETAVGDEFDISVLEEQHETFGLQYNILTWGKSLPLDEDGLRKYFMKNFTGIGEKRAGMLLGEFGSGVIHLLEGDIKNAVELITERLKWTEDFTESLVRQWQDAILPKRMEFLMLGAGMSNRQIARVKEQLGDAFTSIIQTNPYRLTTVGGVGFITADKIALKQGVERNSPFRVWAAVTHVLTENSKGGDCFMNQNDLIFNAAKVLRIPSEEIKAVLGTPYSEDDPLYKDEYNNWWLSWIHWDEQRSAEFLTTLIETPSGIPTALDDKEWQRVWTNFQIESGIVLTEEQKSAVRLALSEKVIIITGNPGTGKTTLLKAVLSTFEAVGHYSLALCAPTGKAARRMSAATGRETMTIHRLLGIGTGEGSFSHLNPLPSDIVVVDEFSMVDISLFATLVSSVKRSARLILIGDQDQLASVGPGRVLADLLEAQIPHIRLTQPQRQAADSHIVQVAHAINNGKLPVLPRLGDPENVWFAEVRDDQEAKDQLQNLVERFIQSQIPIERVKCLSPKKEGVCGVHELNAFLQNILNPPHRTKRETTWGRKILRENDSLIQLKNDRNLDLMNGEEITVRALRDVEKDQESEVYAELETEDGREISLPVSELVMQHSSCLTIHKSQGSEWEIIVLFCLPSQMGFFSRRMLYTGLTRARKLCVIIGDSRSLGTVISRNFETRRKTKLTMRVEKCRNSRFVLSEKPSAPVYA